MTNTLSLFFGEWTDAVTEIRHPFWLSKADRVALAEAIVDLARVATIFPTMRERLDAVLTELGVVEARDHVWPSTSDIVRRSHGYTSDTLPIRMSEEELTAVLSIPTLPTALHQQLAGPTEKK